MRTGPGLAALSLAAAAVLSACGEPEPRFRHRTAPEWVESLWSGEVEDVDRAVDALLQIAERKPDAVLAALEARMRLPPPRPAAAPFTVVVDYDGARRLGIEVPAPGETAALVIPRLRARTEALGFVPTTMRATMPGEIDVVGTTPHPRATVERVQAALCLRGALDLRVAVPDPASPPPPHAVRRAVYDDPVPYGERRAGEIDRWRRAQAEDRRYEPASPRWRVAPRADVAPTAPEAFVLLEEPEDAASAVDELVLERATAVVEEGVVVLGAALRAERATAAKRFFAGNTGLPLAVVLDGEVRAVAPMPATDGRVVRFPLGPAPKGKDPAAWGRDLAAVLPTGRLPIPLQPVPISERYDADPTPDNPFSRVLASLGRRARPLVDRIAAGDFPSWSKSSAAWAKEHAVD